MAGLVSKGGVDQRSWQVEENLHSRHGNGIDTQCGQAPVVGKDEVIEPKIGGTHHEIRVGAPCISDLPVQGYPVDKDAIVGAPPGYQCPVSGTQGQSDCPGCHPAFDADLAP